MTVHAGPKRGAGGVQLGFSRREYHVKICGKASCPSKDASSSGTPMCNTWHTRVLDSAPLSDHVISLVHSVQSILGQGRGFAFMPRTSDNGGNFMVLCSEAAKVLYRLGVGNRSKSGKCCPKPWKFGGNFKMGSGNCTGHHMACLTHLSRTW